MNDSPIEPTDLGFRRALAQFRDVRRPPERGAAVWLAVTQRHLDTALGSSPAVLAGYGDVTDPEREYAAWVQRMVDAEQLARTQAALSVREGRRYRRRPDPAWTTDTERAAGRAAVARAASAIAAMLGADVGAAARAREDVLRRWPGDDEAAELAFVLDHQDRRP